MNLGFITVVIPVSANRPTLYGEYYEATIESIRNQTIGETFICTISDEGKGANYARNYGFEFARQADVGKDRKLGTPFVLFSDDDIVWEPDAFENLYHALYTNPRASYSYGWYEMDGKRYCNQPFDAERLRSENYISTMSLIRTPDFPGFDEKINRLQDWDLWLTLLNQGKTGVYCGEKIFTTQIREGITFGVNGKSNPNAWRLAENIIKTKHRLVDENSRIYTHKR